MAEVARQSGLPDLGRNSTMNFVPEVYSGKLVEKVYKTTVFGEIASTDYEGEIAGYGSNVKIRTVPDISVSAYVIGNGLNPVYPSSTAVTLSIDKANSFAVALNLVDQRQSDIDMADVFANEASIRLRIAADVDMLASIPASVSVDNQGRSAGVQSDSIDLGDSTTPLSLTKTNIIDYIVDFGTVLDEQSVPDDGRWLVLPPWAVALIKKSDLRIASLAGDDVSILRGNGKVGLIDRFMVYQSQNLLAQTTPGLANYAMFGHSMGLTFASQIVECEMITNPNDFGWIVRGLMVYGYSVIEGKYIGTAVIKKG
jgi:hypothetical protein